MTNVSKPTDTMFLDYVMSRVTGDQRPYLEITILGCPVVGLLDSGASRTIVGASGLAILQRLGLRLNSCETVCTVANGQRCSSIGYVTTPFCLENRVKLIDVLVVPELPHRLILGVDFWISMDIVPDLRQRIWQFSDQTPSVDIGSISSKLTPDQELF